VALLRTPASLAVAALLLLVAGCGGGGGDGAPTPEPNVQSVTVGPGPANNVNLLFTTVTVCAPGSTSNCQSLDNVLVDTGSTGLRIFASLLSPSLGLQQHTGAGGNPIAACGQFVDGFTWGPVKIADVRMGAELASAIPIQVISDPAFSVVPGSCSGTGSASDTPQAVGANGILGLNVFQQDCGPACANSAIAGAYYVCPSSGGCQPTQVALAQQLQNPVGMFSADNNGVMISLPAISASGAPGVNGLLVFGIGTRGNNGLGGAQVVPLDPTIGTFTTRVNGSTVYPGSFLDSGSNAFYFAAGFNHCSSDAIFHCPVSPQNLSAENQGFSGPPSVVSFQVANADNLFFSNPGFFAFNNLAGDSTHPSFDWGLPFFYGRNVYTAIEGRSTPGGTGPYVAY
jgi:hypothetical protein